MSPHLRPRGGADVCTPDASVQDLLIGFLLIEDEQTGRVRRRPFPPPEHEATALRRLVEAGALSEDGVRALVTVTPRQLEVLRGLSRPYPRLAEAVEAALRFRRDVARELHRLGLSLDISGGTA